jgi:hypothetical protein
MNKGEAKRHIKVVVAGGRYRNGNVNQELQKRLTVLKTKYPDLAQMLIDFCDISYSGPPCSADCEIARPSPLSEKR